MVVVQESVLQGANALWSIALQRIHSKVLTQRPVTGDFADLNDKTPVCVSRQGFWNLILTMTYSHMGKPHTTIGDASFHC